MLEFLVVGYMAIADRMRGGFPDDNFWKPNPAPRWKHWLRFFIWQLSGGVLAVYLTQPITIADWCWCLLASVLFGLGERQNMGVIGWLYPNHSKQFMGWLHQFRIGALWALVTSPLYFVSPNFIPMIVGCFFGPIFGALLGKFIHPRMPNWCFQLNGQWAWTEFYRGLMMGSISIVVFNTIF